MAGNKKPRKPYRKSARTAQKLSLGMMFRYDSKVLEQIRKDAQDSIDRLRDGTARMREWFNVDNQFKLGTMLLEKFDDNPDAYALMVKAQLIMQDVYKHLKTGSAFSLTVDDHSVLIETNELVYSIQQQTTRRDQAAAYQQLYEVSDREHERLLLGAIHAGATST